MEKKVSINIEKKRISGNFVREIINHRKIYVLDEVEYLKFHSTDFKNPVLNINCEVLEYEEKENEVIYTLKSPKTFVLLPSNQIEVVATHPKK